MSYVVLITVRFTFPCFIVATITAAATARRSHFVAMLSMCRLLKATDTQNTCRVSTCANKKM